MQRAHLTEKILDIKREKGWSWKFITGEIGGMPDVLIAGLESADRRRIRRWHHAGNRFRFAMERLPDRKGDRVRITMCGKFLPYKYYGARGNHPANGLKEE